MSRTIDEKVVEMRFDNRDFERNVSQSMSTLDKLKSALNFSGAEKAFSGITSAAHKLDFGPLGGAIDGVGQKFSALETMAVGALMNIGATIESNLVNKLKSVTIDQVTEGWDKYADKTTSVQTIMNATGKSIDEVSEKLDALNWFTDETSYNFTDMTSNIGKFTSQRVALDDAVVAMEGISTAAALAGQNAASASRVMYNFSQALGMGSVQVRDWMSVENANMATEEFRQTIIDTAIELGRLDKYGNFLFEVGKGYTGPQYVDALNFRDTLAADWFNSEVLIESLKKFGGFSNRLNEVYNQFNENYDVTTSQILTWLNEYMDGTLDINEAVKKTGLTAEEILPVLEELSSDEYELGRRALIAAQEAKTFDDVVNATADAVSTAWMNVFEKIFGNYEEARVTWTQLSNELWDIFAGPISNLNDLLTDWHDMGGREDFIQSVKNMYHAVRSFLDPIGEAWESVFPPKTADDIYNFTKRLKEFGERLALNETQMNQVRMVFEDFFGIFKAFSSGFSSFGDGFTGFFEGIGNALRNVGTPIYDFLLGVQRIRSAMEAFENGDLSEFSFVQQTIDAYPAAAKFLETYEKIVDTAYTLGHMFGKLINLSDFFKDGALSIDSVIDGIKIKFATILGTMSEIIHLWTGKDISKIVDNLRAIFFGLADGIKAFLGSERWAEVKYVISGIAAAFKDTFGPAWQAAVTILDDWINGIRTLIEGANGDFSGFFDTITRGAYHIASFVRSLKGGVEFVSDFLVKFLSLTDAINTYRENGGGIVGILAVVHEKLKIILDTVFDIVQNVTGLDLHSVGDGIISVIESIERAVLQVADTIAKAFGWNNNPFGKLLGMIDTEYAGFDSISVNLTGIFAKIGEAFSKLGELFKAAAPGIQSALSGVKVVLLDVIQLFKDLGSDMSLPDLLHLVMQIVSVFSAIRLAKKAGEALEAIADALTSWQKTLKVKMLMELGATIVMIAGAAYLISKIDNEKIGLVIGTLAASFGGLIGVLLASQKGNAASLATLPGIILSVAASMIAVSIASNKFADAVAKFGEIENATDAVGNFVIVLTAVSVLLAALTKVNSKWSAKEGLANVNMYGQIASGIIKLAVAMTLMAGAIKLYSMMDLLTIGEGLVKIVGVLAVSGASLGGTEFLYNLIAKLSGSFGTMESTASALLKFAGAIAIIAVVAGALTFIKWGDLVNSLGKMVAAIAAFSVGLVIFSAALAIVGKLNVTQVLDGVAGAIWKFSKSVALLVVVAAIIGLVSQLFGDSLTEIVEKGLDFIEYALNSLSERSATIAYDVAVIVMDIIRESMRVIAENAPELGQYFAEILGGLIHGIKEAITTEGVDIWEMIGGAGLLGGLIGLVAFLKKNKIGVRDFGAAALALAGAALLLAEIGVLFAGIGYLSDALGGTEGLRLMQEFCSSIVSVFTDDWGVLVMFGVLMAFELLMAKFGNRLGGWRGAFNGFKTASALLSSTVMLVGEFGGLIAATGEIINFIDSLNFLGEGSVIGSIENASRFYDAIIAVFVGKDEAGKSDPKGGLIGLFLAVGAVVGVLAGLKIDAGGGMLGALGTVAGAIISAVAIIDLMGVLFAITGGVIEIIQELGGSNIIEWVNTAGDFLEAISVAIGKFAGGFVGGAIQGISDNVTDRAVSVVKAMGEVMVAISEAGLLANAALWTGGATGLVSMMAEFGQMGPHFKSFAEGIKDIPDDLADKAATCATATAALIAAVPSTGGVPQFFKGKKDLEAFGVGLKLIAEGIKNYAGVISEMAEDDLASLDSRSKQIADIIETVCDAIPTTNAGWKLLTEGDNNIKTFGERLESFGLSLQQYSKTIGSDDVKLVAMNNTAASVLKICDYADRIAGLGSDNIARISTFGNNLVVFSSSLKTYYKDLQSLDQGKLDNISSSVSSIIDAFIVSEEDMTLAGKVAEMTADFLDKLVVAFGSDATKTKSDTAADKFIDYFKNRFAEDASINKISVSLTDMVTKAVGDKELKEGLKTAGLDLIKEIQNGIEEAFTGDEGLIKKFEQFLTQLETSIDTGGQTGRAKRFYDAGAALMNALRNGMLNEEAISGFGVPPAKQLKDDFQALLDSLIGMIVSEEMKDKFQRGGASLVGVFTYGMTSFDIAGQAKSTAVNAIDGFVQGVEENKNKVEQAARDVVKAYDGTIRGPISKGGMSINSPSWLEELTARFAVQGFVDGVYNMLPNVKEAVTKLVETVKNGTGDIDIMAFASNLGLNQNGFLEDQISNFISQFGAEDMFNAIGQDVQGEMDNLLSSLQSGEITSGSGLFDQWMTDFQNEYASSVGDMSNMGYGALDSFTAGTEEYVNNGYVADSATMVTDEMSSVYGDFVNTSGDYGRSGVYSYADNVISAAEEVKPALVTASESLGDATVEPLEERMAEMLSYADWVAQKYPEGIEEAFSTPVFDFEDLYSNMQGGQLEALLNEFDALDEAGRKNLIRAYGLGEQGGNEDLANYLQWYWKNEPIRIQNEEAIARAQEGYQAYLEEQKALQEAQAVQSQQQYEGVQQIAADMQTHTDEFNAKYLAVVEEIKMNVAALREELDGVHADIVQLNDMYVYLDGDTLVGATAGKMDEKLGNNSVMAGRRVTR